jgi:hypothetical protein
MSGATYHYRGCTIVVRHHPKQPMRECYSWLVAGLLTGHSAANGWRTYYRYQGTARRAAERWIDHQLGQEQERTT